ncbi:MAG: hypothetical protein Q7S70_00975 [bacterium]|nr:hypothetical protein [bacterium]
MQSVQELFIPKDVARIVTIGPRDPEMGVDWSSRMIVDGSFRGSGGNVQQFLTGPSWTFDQLKGAIRGFPHINNGGISDKACWFQVFGRTSGGVGLSDQLTLGEIKAAFERGDSAPIVPAYWLAIEECLNRAGEENFRQAHGFGRESLLDMPMEEAQKVGRTKKSRDSKVPMPNWTFLARKWQDNKYQAGEVCRVSWVPGTRLQDCFIAGVRRSVFDPTKWAIYVIGGRGGSTVAANAILDRMPLVTGETGPGKEVILRFAEGIEIYHDTLLSRIKEATERAQSLGKGVEGFEWFGECELDKVGEQLGWPVKAVVPKWNLKGIDFGALIGGVWHSGEELFPEEKLLTISLRQKEAATI